MKDLVSLAWVERVSGDKERFILQSGANGAIVLQSVVTEKYLSRDDDGQMCVETDDLAHASSLLLIDRSSTLHTSGRVHGLELTVVDGWIKSTQILDV